MMEYKLINNQKGRPLNVHTPDLTITLHNPGNFKTQINKIDSPDNGIILYDFKKKLSTDFHNTKDEAIKEFQIFFKNVMNENSAKQIEEVYILMDFNLGYSGLNFSPVKDFDSAINNYVDNSNRTYFTQNKNSYSKAGFLTKQEQSISVRFYFDGSGSEVKSEKQDSKQDIMDQFGFKENKQEPNLLSFFKRMNVLRSQSPSLRRSSINSRQSPSTSSFFQTPIQTPTQVSPYLSSSRLIVSPPCQGASSVVASNRSPSILNYPTALSSSSVLSSPPSEIQKTGNLDPNHSLTFSAVEEEPKTPVHKSDDSTLALITKFTDMKALLAPESELHIPSPVRPKTTSPSSISKNAPTPTPSPSNIEGRKASPLKINLKVEVNHDDSSVQKLKF